ncbi:hypothetical protein FB45DRAFT_447232 [Roridomyces roridus]|uniref:Cell wall galactomannoprotein n=1 Tax=Roridomyces roridus TaxID=1738132 RepID=A0AAD7FTC5_9AGAR|nr:hypothetical protein FB45DRAFT_447232 [Roridomyces roridus]
MFFSRLTALFLLSATALVSAHPTDAGVAVAKREYKDIDTVCYNLKSATEEILPKIDAIVKKEIVLTVVLFDPLIKELTYALETAVADLADLAIEEDETKKEEIAGILAEIVEEISASLDAALKKAGILLIPDLILGFAVIDTVLKKVLLGADAILGGVLILVGGLIGGVVGLLKDLAFKLTLGSCGYY